MEGSQRSEATPRLPVELDVDFATEQMAETETLKTQDVGEGGLFLKTHLPLNPGTRFGCRFHIGGEPILAEGEVAWVRTGEPDSDPPPGMGVRFVAVHPEDAQRLRQFVLGLEPDPDQEGDLPRVSFQLRGLGQPLPGEFMAMSESGLAAVAELPFLKLGSTVTVNIDEPGREGPISGQIAWLSLEQDDLPEGAAPRIRLGIHFHGAPPEDHPEGGSLEERGGPVEDWSLSAPVELTRPKVVAEPEGARSVPCEAPLPGLSEPTAEELAALDSSFQTPWQTDIAARPKRAFSRRRRPPRGRGRGGASLGPLLASLRQRAGKNPRAALGVGVGALVLVLTLGLTFAFSGSSSRVKKARKTEAKGTVAGPVSATPAAEPPATPSLPAQAAVAAAPAGAPPLPASGAAGKDVLASGPGVHADPGKVLAKGGAGHPLLADPGVAARPERPAPRRVTHFRLGNKLVLKLELRSRPGRVKHYLLANPDGTVIDVTGASPALKPGRYKISDSRVHMVKVLHRGKGARFIVYFGKRVRKPKIRVVKTAQGVSFVMSGVRPRGRALARRSVSRAGERRNRGRASRDRRTARAVRGKASRGVRKVRRSRRPRKVRRRQARPRAVPPVAEAAD